MTLLERISELDVFNDAGYFSMYPSTDSFKFQLQGTEFVIEVHRRNSPFSTRWFKKPDLHKEISFDEVLNQLPFSIKTELIYNLDLFTK